MGRRWGEKREVEMPPLEWIPGFEREGELPGEFPFGRPLVQISDKECVEDVEDDEAPPSEWIQKFFAMFGFCFIGIFIIFKFAEFTFRAAYFDINQLFRTVQFPIFLYIVLYFLYCLICSFSFLYFLICPHRFLCIPIDPYISLF